LLGLLGICKKPTSLLAEEHLELAASLGSAVEVMSPMSEKGASNRALGFKPISGGKQEWEL